MCGVRHRRVRIGDEDTRPICKAHRAETGPNGPFDMDPIQLAYILIAVGIVLTLAELVLPTGFVLVAIGVCSALLGVGLLFMYASMETAVTALLSLCVGGPLLGGFLFYLWPYSPMGRKLIRASQEGDTVASMAGNVEMEGLRGQTGRAVSPLRPAGVA